MTAPIRVAVIDIGKTNAKVVIFDLGKGEEILVRSTSNCVVDDGPYPHFDIEALWSFIVTSLRALRQETRIDAISITAHGATAVLLDGDGNLAMPVLDYEHSGPDQLAAAYGEVRPPFSETGSPRLPGGLNIGAQIFWQQQRFPDRFARVKTIITYPQYWAFRLSGVAAGEVTTLGCHSDLWAPASSDYSSLVDRMGWREKMAPIRKASDALGPIRSEIAEATGLSPQTMVYCGLHDSNASLLPHLWAGKPPFSVVSTGTWVVVMAMGARPRLLDEARDTLINVNAMGDPVPSSRFMGGRSFQLLAPSGSPDISAADRRRVLEDEIFLLPSQPMGSGPFPNRASGWTCDEASLGDGQRLFALSCYLALMTTVCLDLIGADGNILVEGPFAANPVYLQMLNAATGRPVCVGSGGTAGTSLGAAGLAVNDRAAIAPKVHEVDAGDVEALARYARSWMARIGQG